MKRYLLLIFIVQIAAGCSNKSLYNYSDLMLSSYIDSMVTLDEPLQKKVDSAIKVFHHWHRTTQLQQYATWLSQLHSEIASGHSLSVNRHLSSLNFLLNNLTAEAYRHLIALMPYMSYDEVVELYESFEQQNQKFYRKYVAIEEKERTELYHKNIIEQFEKYLGSLTKEQEQILFKYSSKLRHTSRKRYLNNLDFQRKLQSILISEKTITKKQQMLQDLVEKNSNRNEHDKDSLYNQDVIKALIVEVYATISAEQKQHLLSWLLEYQELFESLANE